MGNCSWETKGTTVRERSSVSCAHVSLVLNARVRKSDHCCCTPWFFSCAVKPKVDYKILSQCLLKRRSFVNFTGSVVYSVLMTYLKSLFHVNLKHFILRHLKISIILWASVHFAHIRNSSKFLPAAMLTLCKCPWFSKMWVIMFIIMKVSTKCTYYCSLLGVFIDYLRNRRVIKNNWLSF